MGNLIWCVVAVWGTRSPAMAAEADVVFAVVALAVAVAVDAAAVATAAHPAAAAAARDAACATYDAGSFFGANAVPFPLMRRVDLHSWVYVVDAIALSWYGPGDG